jgi:DNA-binding HxlR family transcriptional regulator
MKGQRTDLGKANCGIARALQIIGDWWSLLIVRDAFQGRQRFGEFQKSLGIAKNILSTRLSKLVHEGILRVEVDPANARSHRYLLTPKGEQLFVVLIALWQWGEAYCFEADELINDLVETKTGAPLPRMRPRATSGELLGAVDFRLATKRNR